MGIHHLTRIVKVDPGATVVLIQRYEDCETAVGDESRCDVDAGHNSLWMCSGPHEESRVITGQISKRRAVTT